MKNVTSAEKKLELMHQIRSQYQLNQQDLRRRESLLYGQMSTGYKAPSNSVSEEDDQTTSRPKKSSKIGLKLRWAFAIISFIFIIFCDQRNFTVGGIKTKEVFQLLVKDYQETLSAWADSLIVDISKTK